MELLRTILMICKLCHCIVSYTKSQEENHIERNQSSENQEKERKKGIFAAEMGCKY